MGSGAAWSTWCQTGADVTVSVVQTGAEVAVNLVSTGAGAAADAAVTVISTGAGAVVDGAGAAPVGWATWTGAASSPDELPLRQDLLHHVPVHVGQAEVAALELEGQPLVVDAEQVQHRRVQVVDVDDVLRRRCSRARRSRRR